MKLIDIIIVLLLAWFAFQGFRKGLVDGVVSLLALLVGAWCAIPFSPVVQKILVPTTETRYLISLLISFLFCIVAVYMIGKLFKISLSFALPKLANQLLGAVFGALKVLLGAGIVFYCISSIDKGEKILTKEWKASSAVYAPCCKTAGMLLPKIFDFAHWAENQEGVQKHKTKNKEALKNR